MRVFLVFLALSLAVVAHGFHLAADCTITVAQNTASAACLLPVTGAKYDMQCDKAPVRCLSGTTSAVAATSTSFVCIRDATDTYPADPGSAGHQYVSIRPEAAGDTTCRIYRTGP